MATTMLGSDAVPALEPVRLVRPDGTRVDDARHVADLPSEQLVAMYEAMVVTRAVDQELIHLQRQGQLALYPSCRGQEGAQVGMAAALDERDWLFPQYRELGAWVWRGVDPGGLGIMWRGARLGAPGLTVHNSAPITISIGSHGLHAVGYAMGAALDDDPIAVVACLGDGATSEGDFHEALNFAAVFAAPCVFFVQNNQYAISMPVHEQTKSASIAHKAVAYGMPGIRCDGNDVLATYAVVQEAAARARAGGGPTLVEAVTYRMEAHTTSDDPTRYRGADELEQWARLDPITRFRLLLQREGVLTDDAVRGADRRGEMATQQLREAVVDAPDPDTDDLFAHVFSEPTAALLEQREALRDEGA